MRIHDILAVVASVGDRRCPCVALASPILWLTRLWPSLHMAMLIGLASWVLAVAARGEARTIQVSLGDYAGRTLQGPAGGMATTWNARGLQDGVLKDSSGNNTGVNFTAAGTGPCGDWWCDLDLLSCGLYDEGGGSLPLVITGLDSAKTYNLYLASSWGDKESYTSFWSSNKTDTPSPQTADNRVFRNGSAWVCGMNYVLFQNMLPDGVGQIIITYGGVGTYGVLNGFQIVESGLATGTYNSWATTPTQELTSGLNDGPMDDPDHDGIVNLLEFALGSQPMVASREALPTMARSDGGWVFEYDRNVLSRPPVTIQVVEYSSDLVTWIPMVVPLASADNITITDNGSSDHVKVIIPLQQNATFARLRVAR